MELLVEVMLLEEVVVTTQSHLVDLDPHKCGTNDRDGDLVVLDELPRRTDDLLDLVHDFSLLVDYLIKAVVNTAKIGDFKE